MPLHLAHASRAINHPDVALTVHGQRPGAASGMRVGRNELELIHWGATESTPEGLVDIVANFAEVELEYAAVRRGAGLLDSPHRGALLVTGSERIEFLNRMLTQELNGLTSGQSRESFWLNRKGRIDADMLVIELGDRMLIELDLVNAAAAAKSLNEFLFTEDLEIRDVSGEMHHIAVHGSMAKHAVAAACGGSEEALDLDLGEARSITVDSKPLIVVRRDQVGDVGLHLIMKRVDAQSVWEFLVAADHVVGAQAGGAQRVRPIGWHAFNIARIESGEALFNIDFGPTNLPHQVGELFARRVSLTKGCYLGQEVVARMHSRGHSKPVLVGLRMKEDVLPIAGAQVFAAPQPSESVGKAPRPVREDASADGELGELIGVVTSSSLSPMLGAVPICLAMLRTKTAPPGSSVLVNAEGRQARAIVGPLRLWSAAR